MYRSLEEKIRDAKAAFEQVVIHLDKNRIDLSNEDRDALKQLKVFWSGNPLRHNQMAFHAIKAYHRLNGREGTVKSLWDAYIRPLMEARCMMMGMAHEFPEISVSV